MSSLQTPRQVVDSLGYDLVEQRRLRQQLADLSEQIDVKTRQLIPILDAREIDSLVTTFWNMHRVHVLRVEMDAYGCVVAMLEPTTDFDGLAWPDKPVDTIDTELLDAYRPFNPNVPRPITVRELAEAFNPADADDAK